MSTAFAVAGLLLGFVGGVLLAALLAARRAARLRDQVERCERGLKQAEQLAAAARADLQNHLHRCVRERGGLGQALAATADTVQLPRVPSWPVPVHRRSHQLREG